MLDDNLEHYLSYYLRLESPGYAVLVTGEWGAGKTFQTLNIIPKPSQCHISLFGINSTTEIYSTVFSKMYPGKSFSKKLAKLAKDITSEINGVTFGAGAFVGNFLNAVIKETVDKSKVIIFDDLERCPLKNSEILGVINKYVEHHQCRVIILAHDQKVHDDFIYSKEKVIGHTLRVKPQYHNASEAFFVEKFRLNNFSFIKPLIIESFIITGCQSLRILKYVINDCDRLLSCLEPAHIKNYDAMISLFGTFCIINTEFRSGNILEEDIEDIRESHQHYSLTKFGMNDEKGLNEEGLSEKQKRLLRLFSKYNEFEIISDTLNDRLFSDILVEGNYDSREITKSLNHSKYFITPQGSAPWEIIINFDSIDNKHVNKAINDIFEQIKNKNLLDLGEMLHVFHLLFMLSEKNAVDEDLYEIRELEINYINKLLYSGLLTPASTVTTFYDDDIYERAYNHTYWLSDTYRPYIDNVINHLKKSREIALKNQYKKFSNEILSALENDIDNFKFIMLGNKENYGKYSMIDILNYIDPEDFLMHWLMQPMKNWDKVRMVLNSRYRNLHNSKLSNEKNWIHQLWLTMLIESQRYQGLERSRIERLIPYGAIRAL